MPVRLKDIADVRQGYKDREGVVRVGGHEAIELAVYKEGDSNTVSVAAAVKKQLNAFTCLRSGIGLPLDTAAQIAKLDTIDDQSIFIQSSLDDVRNDAIIGGILAVLIIFFLPRRFVEHVHHFAVVADLAHRDVLLHGAGWREP